MVKFLVRSYLGGRNVVSKIGHTYIFLTNADIQIPTHTHIHTHTHT